MATALIVGVGVAAAAFFVRQAICLLIPEAATLLKEHIELTKDLSCRVAQALLRSGDTKEAPTPSVELFTRGVSSQK